MDLPAELRNKIYHLALVATEDPLVPRDTLEPRPGLRFRYNRKPHLWKAMTPDSTAFLVSRNDVEPINTRRFAFGLFLVSRSTYNEATPVFYEGNHFVFDDRFSLHIFIMTIGEKNAEHIRSISVDWRKSTGTHSKEIKESHSRWKLRSILQFGPRVAESVIELRNAFPQLEYLEMRPCPTFHLSRIDLKENEKHYSEWTIVKELCSLNVARFSFIIPWQQSNYQEKIQLYLEINTYINNQIRLRPE